MTWHPATRSECPLQPAGRFSPRPMSILARVAHVLLVKAYQQSPHLNVPDTEHIPLKVTVETHLLHTGKQERHEPGID